MWLVFLRHEYDSKATMHRTKLRGTGSIDIRQNDILSTVLGVKDLRENNLKSI